MSLRACLLAVALILISGCRLNEKYVEADRSTYEFISSRLRKMIVKERARDPEQRIFDDDEIEDIELKLDTWDLRVRRAEKFLEIDNKPPNSIWDGWEPW